MGTAVTDRVRKHRRELRKAGLKPVQIWLPDTRSSAFRRKCRKESLSLRGDPHEKQILDWVARASDLDGWV
jgi:hypothetical protein